MNQLNRNTRDIEAIRDVIAEYCDAVDHFDARRAAAVYSLRAEDNHLGNRLSGRAAIERFLREGLGFLECSAHVITNHRVQVDGKRARSSAYVMHFGWTGARQSQERAADNREVAPFASGLVKRNVDHLFIGRYDDELRRKKGQWRIKRRTVNVATVLGADIPSVTDLMSEQPGEPRNG